MIGDFTSIARPYAVAAFEYAETHKALPAWDGFLQSAASMVQHKDMATILNNPHWSSDAITKFFYEVLAAIINPPQKNFIELLALNKRLVILPDIAKLFKQYRADYEKRIEVQVISAVKLDAKWKAQLEKRLTEKLNRHVTLTTQIDPSLLGGAVLRAGRDIVIDGSVRGKLNRLLESLR